VLDTAEFLEGSRSQHHLTDEDVLLTRREAAAYLRRSVGTLELWAATGKGPACRKVGGKTLYPLSTLRRFAGVAAA
jgi:Helix-turn-helix domain